MEAEGTLSQALGMLVFHFSISVLVLFLGWTFYYDFTRMRIPPGITQGAKLRLINLAMSLVLRLGERMVPKTSKLAKERKKNNNPSPQGHLINNDWEHGHHQECFTVLLGIFVAFLPACSGSFRYR
ncbi:hypothetical protein E2320_006104 [Naja naja]|nr:hypothetical protein E2320_006104 [Naja naja]